MREKTTSLEWLEGVCQSHIIATQDVLSTFDLQRLTTYLYIQRAHRQKPICANHWPLSPSAPFMPPYCSRLCFHWTVREIRFFFSPFAPCSKELVSKEGGALGRIDICRYPVYAGNLSPATTIAALLFATACRARSSFPSIETTPFTTR